MRYVSGILVCLLLLAVATESMARRSHITNEQRAQLAKVNTIYLNVLALTENGRVPPDKLLTTAKTRLEAIGYKVVTDRKEPHDVQFRIKCEERKRWTGTTRSGGDAELADAPARLWKGPACLFNYRLEGRDLGWYKETRTDFVDAYAAAQKAKAKSSGQYALDQLNLKLQEFDFPVMIATEWRHTDRLAQLLENPDTDKRRKLRILSTLSRVQSKQAFPHLVKLARDENAEYAEEAIIALAGLGRSATPILTDIFVTTQNFEDSGCRGQRIGLGRRSYRRPRHHATVARLSATRIWKTWTNPRTSIFRCSPKSSGRSPNSETTIPSNRLNSSTSRSGLSGTRRRP